MKRTVASTFTLLVALQVLLASRGRAEEPLESLIPDDVVAYASVHGLGARIEELLKSDLRKELEGLDVVKQAFATEGWQKLEAVLATFKADTGKDAQQVVDDLLGKELVIGARLGFGGPEVVLVTRARSEGSLEEGIKTLKLALEKRGVQPPLSTSTHGDREIESLDGKISHTRLGSIWVLSNSKATVERVIDLSGGKSASSLLKSPLFSRAKPGQLDGALIRAAVRPKYLPNYDIPEKVDNALGSLIAGGWLAALDASDLIAASVRLEGGSLLVKVASVLGNEAGSSKRWQAAKSFFPQVVPDGVRERLEKRGVLAITEIQRDLSGWWEAREEQLTSKAVGGLVEFSNIMNVMFAPRSFQDEVLPDIGPTIAMVARNQDYAGLAARPEPSIPAFAAIFQLKNAEESNESLVSAFNSLVTVINLDRAQKKQDMGMRMMTRVEKVGEVEMQTVTFRTAAKGKEAQAKPGMLANFSPSLAVVGSRVIIGSSTELTRLLIEELATVPASATGSGRATDTVRLDGPALRKILAENRDFLIANQMVKKGVTREAAQGEIDLLLGALRRVQGLRLDSARKDDAVVLDLKLSTDLGGAAAATVPAAREPAKSAASKKGVKL